MDLDNTYFGNVISSFCRFAEFVDGDVDLFVMRICYCESSVQYTS